MVAARARFDGGAAPDAVLRAARAKAGVPTPSLVASLEAHRVVRVAAGETHTLAVTVDGDVWSFGSNKHGQLGVGRPGGAGVARSSAPLRVRGSTGELARETVVAVAAGAHFSLVATAAGRTLAWGLLFKEEAVAARDAVSHLSLPTLAARLSENDFLRRLVMKSNAAYLAAAPKRSRRRARAGDDESTHAPIAAGEAGEEADSAGGAPAWAPGDDAEATETAAAEAAAASAGALRHKLRRDPTWEPTLVESLAGSKVRCCCCSRCCRRNPVADVCALPHTRACAGCGSRRGVRARACRYGGGRRVVRR